MHGQYAPAFDLAVNLATIAGLAADAKRGGAQWLLLPTAFTRQTGPGHWRTLLQARAIENRAFVLAELDGEPGLLIQPISLGDVAKRRQQLPSLQHDNPFSIESLNATPEVES